MPGIVGTTFAQAAAAREAVVKALPILQELAEGNLDPSKDIVTGNAALIAEINSTLTAVKTTIGVLTT